MTTYDETKVQLTINRMTQECYDSLSSTSTKELYLISQNPNGVAKIDLDAQGAIQSEISALSAWNATQDSLISELSTQTISNSTDISALSVEIQEVSANMSKSIIRRWEPVAGLRFVAQEANSTVAMAAVGSAPSVSLEYNTGDGWNDFIVSSTGVEGTTVTLANVGDECYIRAKTTNAGMGSGTSTYNKFVMTGKIAASNSIMYLLKNDGDLDTISQQYCFNSLFYHCKSLTTAPELPATTLSQQCYGSMFNGCTNLRSAPELPATTLVDVCYISMFNGCTSLTTAPELPATTLANYCYQNMFLGCTSLNSIKIGYTGNFSGTGVPSDAFYNWVNGVAASGTFYYNGSDTTTGVSSTPSGWTVQTF